MNLRASLCAAAAITLAVAAPLFSQDTTATHRRPGAVFDSLSLRRLPIDDVLDLPVLLPGVYGLTDPRAFSLRGGLRGDGAIYVDGALIRNGQRLDAGLLPVLWGIQSLAVTTGLAPADRSDLRMGSLEIVTPTGGREWTIGFSGRGDRLGNREFPFDLWRNVGFSRLEVKASGGLPAGFTAFVAVQADGQESLETEKLRDAQAPVYIASGTDTTIRQPVDFGNPASDTIDLAIPRFVQYSGYCDKSRNGNKCYGLMIPFTGRGSEVLQAKLQRSYGTDGRVSLTLLYGRQQARDFPWTALYNPVNQTASRTTSNVLILDWQHALLHVRGRPLRLNVNLSYQNDERVTGALTLASEEDSRDLGSVSPGTELNFVTDVSTRHDVTIAGRAHSGVGYLDDTQISCLQAGSAACQDLVPFLDRNDLLSAQPYRMNPYAVEQNAYVPFYTSGLDSPFDLSYERRWQARVGVGWQPAAAHQLSVGLDFGSSGTRRYTAGTISAFQVNAYGEYPSRLGAYIADQVDVGAFELIGAVRVDRFDSRASYPIVPGRIASITDTIAVSGSDTFRLKPFDPLDPTANFRRASTHSILSPQLRVLFLGWPHATVRFSIGRQARAASFESLFAYKNTDLSVTDRNQAFGRDVGPAHAEVIEAGAHITIGSDQRSFADVSVYSANLSDEAVRLEPFSDPGSGGLPGLWRVWTIADRGKVRGIDALLERRFSDVFTGSVSVSHQSGPAIDGARTFASALVAVRFGKEAPLGAVLENTDIYSILRFSSNRRYTLQRNTGAGLTMADEGLESIEPENSSKLPLFKTIDVRITRSFPIEGRWRGAVFVESKNLFNWTNLTDIFTETGKVTNDLYRARWVDQQVAQLETEAQADGLLTVTGSGESAVDLRSPGVCTGWSARTGNGAGGPADCVLLQRAERRFGNSDGLFTQTEYARSFGAWYDIANAPYRFYGPGRRIRFGVEFSF
jgi:hypothetical protein